MNKNIILTAKILFAIPFIVFGVNHFVAGATMGGYIPSYIPGGVFWVYFTGLALIAAGISIMINIKTKLAMRLLALMLGIFMFTIHLPAIFADAGSMGAVIGFLKDLALASGALIIGEVSEVKNNVKQ